MVTITPHVDIFEASACYLVWGFREWRADVTFTATHASDSLHSVRLQSQTHKLNCVHIMTTFYTLCRCVSLPRCYFRDYPVFRGLLCTLKVFNTRLWKDSKPSADINTSNMTHTNRVQVEGRTQLCNHCSCVYFMGVCEVTARTRVHAYRCWVQGSKPAVWWLFSGCRVMKH